MNRKVFLFLGCCMTLGLGFYTAGSLSGPRLPKNVKSCLATPAPTRLEVNEPAGTSAEVHPYVESLSAALRQGTASQIRNEMYLLAEHCAEQPGAVGDILQSLSSDRWQNREALRTFGEILMKGRGKPADELLQQTALAWTKETQDRATQRLGSELLMEFAEVK